jgi:hypothetical protein
MWVIYDIVVLTMKLSGVDSGDLSKALELSNVMALPAQSSP